MLRLAVVLLVVTVPASFAVAESEQFDTIRTNAKPIKRVAPRYPGVELNRYRQGWVDLSFVVTPDGKVIDPIIIDSSGSSAFERAAAQAVQSFEYEPATINGEPVQQCETKTRITFVIEGPPGAVSKNFHRDYRRIASAIEDGEIEEATEKLDKAFERRNLSMAENAWLWTLQTTIDGKNGDFDSQLRSVRRATSNSSWVSEDLYPKLLIVRTSLEIDKGLYADALSTFSLLEETGIQNANTELLRSAINTIEDHVNSDRILSVPATIEANDSCEGCRSNWRYDPLRRQFRIANVNGYLESLEVRCDWQRFMADIEGHGVQIWEMPPSWGECTVYVFGEPGTTFAFYEVP